MKSREDGALMMDILEHRLISHEQDDPVVLPDGRVLDHQADSQVLVAAGQSERLGRDWPGLDIVTDLGEGDKNRGQEIENSTLGLLQLLLWYGVDLEIILTDLRRHYAEGGEVPIVVVCGAQAIVVVLRALNVQDGVHLVFVGQDLRGVYGKLHDVLGLQREGEFR